MLDTIGLPLPLLIESFLVMAIAYILLIRPKKRSDKLTMREVLALCDEWEPRPLIDEPDAGAAAGDEIVLESAAGPYVAARIAGEGAARTMLNLAGFDFLGLSMREELREAAVATLDKYGCGSCGPRGFYGTIDTHVDLEVDLAAFTGSEEAIIYSDGASATSSAIPAFAKRGDLVVADAGCHDAVRTGIVLSRAFVKYFKHNDMADLERVLREISDADAGAGRARGKAVQLQRRFIVAEGLYRNYGDICPLPELVALKERFGFRLILDESFSLGTLGATGRGIAEHFPGVAPGAVEITTASLGNAFASVGGFCAGSREVVDHQRLAGAGYCFSASAPPFLSAVASASLALVGSEGAQMAKRLASNAALLRDAVGGINGLRVTSAAGSPIVHCVLDHDHAEHEADKIADLAVLAAIARATRARGVIVVHAKYVAALEGGIGATPKPSLRLTVSSAHTSRDIAKGASALSSAVAEVLGELS